MDTDQSLPTTPADPNARAEDVEARLRPWVIAAAIASIPALFMSLGDGTLAQVGNTLNVATLILLTGESVILVLVADDKRAWLWRHRWALVVVAVSIPLVVLAAGAGQFLRLAAYLRAFRIVRLNRVLKVGRLLETKTALGGAALLVVRVGIVLIALAFAALILADPDGATRGLITDAIDRWGWPAVATAGAAAGAVAGAGWLAWRRRRDDTEDGDTDRAVGDGTLHRS